MLLGIYQQKKHKLSTLNYIFNHENTKYKSAKLFWYWSISS